MDLSRFFAPRAVAVVGASDRHGTPSAINWRLLRSWAERQGADIWPVNPKRDVVDDLRSYASLTQVPHAPDVVAVLVGDPFPVVADAVEVGAGFVVVFSSGFAEVGDDGRDAQERLRRLVEGTGTRLIGPNTNLNSFEEFRSDLDGPAIALISQSGHQGRPLFMLQENNIRVSHWAPTGNEADVESADFIEWFADQPDIGCIAAYIEGFADGRRFVDAARHARARSTPLVLVKVGRTSAGRAAASSHTGKLAGADRVADGLFRQLGVTRVDTLDELADVAQVMARGRTPRSDGVAIYSISGGTGAHVADLCGQAGLRLAELSPTTITELHRHIPDYLNVSNPVDCGGHPVGDERGERILSALLDDPDVGVLLVPITGPFPPLSDKLAKDLAVAAEHTDALVAVVWGSPVGTETALRETLYGSSRLVTFRSSGNAVRSLAAWLRWHRHLAASRASSEVPAPALHSPTQLPDPGSGPMSEARTLDMLDGHGISTPRRVLVDSADEAAAAAAQLGFPVVLKAYGSRLAHKSELGLVRIGIASAEELREAFASMAERAAPPDGIEGFIVGEQVGQGVEVVVGMVRDPEVGPAVMLGIGGVLVEVLDDVTFRVPPFERSDVLDMLAELRGARLLQGARGAPRADVEALVDVVMAVQRLVLDLGDRLAELDINPVIVRPDGHGAVAVDAYAVITGAPD